MIDISFDEKVKIGLQYCLETLHGCSPFGLERIRRVVEGEVFKVGLLVHLGEKGPQAVQPLEVALDLKELHMVGDLVGLAAAQGVADILHLAQKHHGLVQHGL